MSVAVVVPWRPGCPWRERAFAWVTARYTALHPEWEILTAPGPDGLFSRAGAILDAAEHTDADLLLVADADVWSDGIGQAVEHAAADGWAVPHRLIHRLSPDSTDAVLAGADWRGLPLSTDNRQDSRPYIGNETGTLVAVRRDVLNLAPPDRRFVGWGQEDEAWSCALRTLVGPPWRGDADLVHLWHPPQPRDGRVIGSAAGWALSRRYRRARGHPDEMRSLLAEVVPCSSR